MKVKFNTVLKLYAILCCILNVIIYLMSMSGYVCVYKAFETNRILLYISVLLQIVGLFITDRNDIRVILILSLLYPKDLFSVYLTTIILAIGAVIFKFHKKYINITATISVGIAILMCFVYFLPMGRFITHTSYEMYSNPQNTKTIAVCSDYSFDEKIISLPIACENDAVSMLFFDYYKKIDSVALNRYTTTGGLDEVFWIDDMTVVINGINYTIK